MDQPAKRPVAKTYLRYFTEPHHVRYYQRQALSDALTGALDPLGPGQAALWIDDLATDLLNRGLAKAVARFVDRVLPAVADPAADTSARADEASGAHPPEMPAP